MDKPNALTIGQVSKRLGRSERTIRRYLHDGLLTGRRVDMPAGGQKWSIDRESVEKLEGAPGRHAGAADGHLATLTALLSRMDTDSTRPVILSAEDVERIAVRVVELQAALPVLPPAPDDLAERLDRIEAGLADRAALAAEVEQQKTLRRADRAARREAEAEVARLRRPWWRKVFGRTDRP